MNRLRVRRGEVVLWPLTAVLCSVLAARAVRTWNMEPESVDLPIPVERRPAKTRRDSVSKDSAELVARNMFCSTCTPSDPAAEPKRVATELPLRLIATSVAELPKYSVATIEDTRGARQGSYAVGQVVAPGIALVSVSKTHVSVRHEATKQAVRIALAGGTAKAEQLPEAPPAETSPGVRLVDEHTYEVHHDLFDEALANPMAFAKGVRATPVMREGAVAGFRVSAVRRSSLLHALGVRNGDVVEEVLGRRLQNLDSVMGLYQALREANTIEAKVRRRGTVISLTYRIR